ncbi:MAG: tripartite tricarboxylate transporter substrate binding protein [Burkholderiales bacterium]
MCKSFRWRSTDFRHRSQRANLSLMGLLFASTAALAQSAYPVRPIRMIIPFAPGGSIDTVGRVVSQQWGAALGQQIVIDNRGGVGGALGTEMVARATPDGYTLLYTNAGSLAIAPHMSPRPNYDVFRDFAPVTQVTAAPFILFSSATVPVNTVAELIAYAKARPGQLNYASSGMGSGLHLMAELFKSVTGTDFVHVPFKGLGVAGPEIISGRVHMLINTYAGSVGLHKAGRIRPLLNSGPARSPQLPDVPTCMEAGLPGFCSTSWHAVVAPAGTPPAAIRRLHETLAATFANAELRVQLQSREDSEAIGKSPQELAVFLKSEHAKWGKLIQAAGIK